MNFYAEMAAGPAGDLMISWPTNTSGFGLECATNLPATQWFPVPTPPSIVNGCYVFTNTPNQGNRFYRLGKP